jgi:hypothetical protein
MNDVYVLMNDYTQPNITYALKCYIDTDKDNRRGSSLTFPEYLASPECPEELYMIYNDKKKYLDFDYYHISSKHYISSKLLEVLKKIKSAPFITKKIIPISELTGERLITDRDYYIIYFFPETKAVDIEHSIFEETNEGWTMPIEFKLNKTIYEYDVLELDKAKGKTVNRMETKIGGHIIGTSKFKDAIEASNITGVKLVPLAEAFSHYCRDHHIDISSLKKRQRPKLP